MSFSPNKLIDRISTSGLIPTKDVIERRIRRRKLKLCFSDLRELWASRAVRKLSQPEIDFLQGRVSASVFMQNYFNPMWIADLKTRALENVEELLKATQS